MAAVTAAVVGGGAAVYAANRSSKAAKSAANTQADAGRDAIAFQERAMGRLDESLQPFEDTLGTNLLPQVQNLYGPNAGQTLLNDPLLQALQEDAQRRITAQQASVGRAGTQETANALQDAFLRQGMGLISQQRGDLLNAISMGQNSAALTGTQGMASANNVGNLLTQIGNANSAGIIGSANAQNAGLQNLAGIGGGLMSYFNQPQTNRFDQSYTEGF